MKKNYFQRKSTSEEKKHFQRDKLSKKKALSRKMNFQIIRHFQRKLNVQRRWRRKKRTFFLTRDMIPILVRTCWRDKPSLGTPSANVSLLSAPGSQRWRINNDTYALNTFSDLPRRSRTNLWGKNTQIFPLKFVVWNIESNGSGADQVWGGSCINCGQKQIFSSIFSLNENKF